MARNLGERIGWNFVNGVGWKCVRNSIPLYDHADNGTGAGKKCLLNSYLKPQQFTVIHRRKLKQIISYKSKFSSPPPQALLFLDWRKCLLWETVVWIIKEEASRTHCGKWISFKEKYYTWKRVRGGK